jgi:hypothetical protein
MRRTNMGISPSVDAIESRILLSSAPLLARHALTGVVRDVKAIISTLARTENIDQASARLTTLTSRIPSGPQALAPSWQSDLGLYHPGSAKSLMAAERRILGDLYRYVQGGNAAGNPPATGSSTATSTAPGHAGGGGTTTNPPVSAPSLDSVKIENTTGLALLVTIHLDVPQTPQPSITETIPAQGSSIVPFDFGTATDAFITMDVRRADGGLSPAPWTDISLSQPIGGYNGTLFSISLVGPYFNVSVP